MNRRQRRGGAVWLGLAGIVTAVVALHGASVLRTRASPAQPAAVEAPDRIETTNRPPPRFVAAPAADEPAADRPGTTSPPRRGDFEGND